MRERERGNFFMPPKYLPGQQFIFKPAIVSFYEVLSYLPNYLGGFKLKFNIYVSFCY